MADFVNGTASSTSTSNVEVIAAQGTNKKTYITSIIVANTSTTDSDVAVKNGTTEVMRIPAPANGGAGITLPAPIVGSANTAVNFAASDGVTTMYCTATGYVCS